MKKIALLLMLLATPAWAGNDMGMPFPVNTPPGMANVGSSYGLLKKGALVCGSFDSLKAADTGAELNAAQMKSLNCIVLSGTVKASCLHCELDPRYSFVSITLPSSIFKVWARDEDMVAPP